MDYLYDLQEALRIRREYLWDGIESGRTRKKDREKVLRRLRRIDRKMIEIEERRLQRATKLKIAQWTPPPMWIAIELRRA